MSIDLHDPDLVGKKLSDSQIRFLIHSLQVAISQLGKDLQSIRATLNNDKKDQWQYISDLSKKVEELEAKCQKKKG